MLAESGLYNSLRTHAVSTTGQPMCIYGDPAYPLRIHFQAPFRQRVLTGWLGKYAPIPCNDCDDEYIGQTKRQFGTRLKEHQKAVFLCKKENSALSEHTCLTYLRCATLSVYVPCWPRSPRKRKIQPHRRSAVCYRGFYKKRVTK